MLDAILKRLSIDFSDEVETVCCPIEFVTHQEVFSKYLGKIR